MNREKVQELEACFRAYVRLTDMIARKHKDGVCYLHWPVFSASKDLEGVAIGRYLGRVEGGVLRHIPKVCLSSVVNAALQTVKDHKPFVEKYEEAMRMLEENDSMHNFNRIVEKLDKDLHEFISGDDKTLNPV